MEWAITGDVSIGTVDKEELCYKYVYTCIYMYIHPNPSTQSDIINPRSDMTRVLFNTVVIDAVRCMETCLKYNRARAPPSFSDKAAFTELVTWAWNTTRDPETEVYYEDVFSASFWLSYRSDQNQDSFLYFNFYSGILLRRASGETFTRARRWTLRRGIQTAVTSRTAPS